MLQLCRVIRQAGILSLKLLNRRSHEQLKTSQTADRVSGKAEDQTPSLRLRIVVVPEPERPTRFQIDTVKHLLNTGFGQLRWNQVQHAGGDSSRKKQDVMLQS